MFVNAMNEEEKRYPADRRPEYCRFEFSDHRRRKGLVADEKRCVKR